MSGVIAIVGRPNVGKSALFNRIARRRIAIVHDQPGVTRDRVTAEVEREGRPFTLIDTGGIGLLRGEKADGVIQKAMLEQVDLALEAAHVIILVVNVQEGVVPLDVEVAKKLRATRKPVLVAVNKVDTDRATPGVAEFAELGFEKVLGVTAIHGEGMDDLMEEAVRLLPPWTAPPSHPVETGAEEVPVDPDAPVVPLAPAIVRPLRIAVVGRPNVGKSSMINALTGSQRVIVSPTPGTTRDAVDVPFEVETDGVRQGYVLVDTAGVRKARRIDDSIEYFSVERTKEAINRCDLVVFVLDAAAGILEQDKKIADLIVEARRACIVVMNKWDLMAEPVRKAREAELEERENKTRSRDDRRKRLTTLSEFGEWVQSKLFFLDYAPVIFTSATEGFQLERLIDAVRYVAAQLRQSVPTGILNRTLQDAIVKRQPVSALGHRLKFYYAVQVRHAPPTFRLYVNRDEIFSDQYGKYVGDEIRKSFGYEGCPIIIETRARPKTIDPVRKFKRRPFAAARSERHGGPRPEGVAPKRGTTRGSKHGGPAGPEREGANAPAGVTADGRRPGPRVGPKGGAARGPQRERANDPMRAPANVSAPGRRPRGRMASQRRIPRAPEREGANAPAGVTASGRRPGSREGAKAGVARGGERPAFRGPSWAAKGPKRPDPRGPKTPVVPGARPVAPRGPLRGAKRPKRGMRHRS